MLSVLFFCYYRNVIVVNNPYAPLYRNCCSALDRFPLDDTVLYNTFGCVLPFNRIAVPPRFHRCNFSGLERDQKGRLAAGKGPSRARGEESQAREATDFV